ncbi:ParB N-terminal domain-containing protein [Kineothrix sp. MB12-C1]|uniref:ParB N-terminal domain-containing protein n=1 Tax=Kineothrix sp. MB12-C1 TaxID=3070215 RepID=UPI0027D252DF|nr:ParB N-terminal domain-containing protein [Kineothrix sp. MB12-C1]WMC91317.1 ParB N-terminal domain-containing protein [Kineothrix sp. MB12-C1]
METKYENDINDDILIPIRSDRSTIINAEISLPKVTIIALNKLIKFKNHPFHIYGGERLKALADSIKEIGLQNPVIVRSIPEDKYEILSGHNRIEAVKLLGWNAIEAIIKDDLTEEMAERIVIESNLNQQSFSDWKFSQQIQVIKMYSKYIKDNSQQGIRNDIVQNSTCVHCEHKLEDKPKRLKTRDKISKRLGISSTVFERYRSIAKLDDEILTVVCTMLDEKRLRFMAAFRISQLKPGEIVSVIAYLKDNPEVRPKGADITSLHKKSKDTEDDLSIDEIRKIFLHNTVPLL